MDERQLATALRHRESYRKSRLVLDPGIGGLPASTDGNYRVWSWLREAVCLGHGGELSYRSLTFGPLFCMKNG